MKVIRFLAVGALLAIAACSKPGATDKPTESAATPAQPPLVTVNGVAISQPLFDEYAQALARKPANELTAEERDQIKEQLVRIALIAEQAEKEGLAKDPDVANRLQLTRLEILQQASAKKYLKENTPTDAELRAEFDAQIASAPLVEYQARHILVSSEEVANKIIGQLNSGNDFGTLAKRLSSHKESAQRGGDLGWFGPRDMDAGFTNAVALLKKGEYTKTPVQTSFGWHVIQLQDTRDRTPPAFDDVKERLSQIVVAKKFRAKSDAMLKAAKIDPPLTTMPAATTAPAAPAATTAPAEPAAK
jgi:peptidyl-prolyl cis-trans isomerase C